MSFEIIRAGVEQADNLRARQFYEKHGFRPDGAQKEITLMKPLTELRYKKEIER